MTKGLGFRRNKRSAHAANLRFGTLGLEVSPDTFFVPREGYNADVPLSEMW